MIYLFDINERLLKVIRKPAIKSALQKYSLTTDNYVSERLTAEVKALNDDELELVEYMAIQSIEDPHLFNYFYVAQKSTKDQITTFTGVQSGIEELRKTPVYDKRPKSTQAEPVINELLQGTNWQARYIAETALHSTNFYYTSVFEALKKLCKVWGLEMQFFVEMNGNGIGARYIDFKKKIGEAVGKRVVYGHNALEILQEVERTNIFTAIVGRGKGEQVSSAEESGKGGDGYGRKITFEDVVWSKAKGDPLDKPKGQKYLEIPEMTQRYGIKNSDGSIRPKIGFVDFGEEEDPNELIKLTYQSLITASRPQLTLKTSSVYLKGVKIGDTIRVVRHDRKLDYDTRIFEITINRLNDQSTDTKLGDRTGESSTSKAQSVADKAIDEFINNEFNSFIQDLPDYIRTADGFNTNWYSEEDPTKKYPKKVMINDIWYKPDPEHEGHKIMLRWTGEVWEEILRTYNEVSLREKIDQKFAELKQAMDEQNAVNEQRITDILKKSDLGRLAEDAKKIAESAKSEIDNIKQKSESVGSELTDFKEKVQTELDGKPNLAKVTELINGVKEQFSSVGLRNYVLGTGTPKTAGNRENVYTLSKDTFAWTPDKDLRLSFDYSTDESVKKFRIRRSVTFKNGAVQMDDAINQYTTGSLSIDATAQKSGRYSQPLGWYRYYSGTAEDVERIDYYVQIDEGSGNVTIKNMMLSTGTNDPDWVPAIEDQQNMVTQAQAEFERTANGLETRLNAISTNFNPDGSASEKFNKYIEHKTAEGLEKERIEISKGYVAKSAYTEKINEIEQHFNLTDSKVAQFATYKNGLDGQYATITKQLSDNQTAYSEFKRTSDTLVQTFGTTGDQIANNVSRMVLNSQLIQTEVAKIRVGGRNLMTGTKEFSGDWFNKAKWTLEDEKYLGLSVYSRQEEWLGLSEIVEVRVGETYTFSAYVKSSIDNDLVFMYLDNRLVEPRASLSLTRKDIQVGTNWKRVSATFSVTKAGLMTPRFERNNKNAKLYVAGYKLELGNVQSDWSQADEDVDAKTEAVRTQVTQLNNSYSIRNLTSAGDVLGQLNLNPDGSIRINEGLLSIGKKTYIEDGVIKGAMIAKAQIDTAHIKEIDASQANIYGLNVNNISGLNAEFIKAKIEFALIEWLKGKRISAINDKTVFDLNEGTLNLYTNTGTIRRIDDTSSSQFLQFAQAGFIGEYMRDSKAARIVIGTNHDRTENTQNESFAGSRLWSGSKDGVQESLYEFVGDRIIFYSNGRYRSPWIIHNNTQDGSSYLIPGNEKGVRHNLGRGDKHFSGAWIDNIFIGKTAVNLGTYVWDILTCFGQLSKANWDLKNQSFKSHVSGVLSKYGFK
ncbi:phage tail spike protein [Streptococcus gordonii]|uniref:phage tail spike protein n=2 Tax=Bacteria TaxID=2 RepID=UPI001EDED25C|nr:phage tail spike protein [Streptococcus gordonii]MCG4823782.1 phage tail protein [Streptococcus gordonii]MCG4847883.1 phage tail protein [Streptococcus gordonii]MDE8687828.1 gp58-like family protein [Streptococcus gordonii]